MCCGKRTATELYFSLKLGIMLNSINKKKLVDIFLSAAHSFPPGSLPPFLFCFALVVVYFY